MSEIFVFGSPCTAHRDAANKSLGERRRPGIIIGKSDEIKGYGVYITRDKVVVMTQHVENVETVSEEQNEQLRRVDLMDEQPQNVLWRSQKGARIKGPGHASVIIQGQWLSKMLSRKKRNREGRSRWVKA